MPHRTRGGGCRPVNCANSIAIGSYEEHCPRSRRYRSGHPAMLLRRSRWLRLVHAVFDTGTTKKNRIWDIRVTQSELGADICNNILFIHAILGCDTTSRLYGLGKGLSLKRFTSSALFRDKAEQFCKKDATVDDVIDAGEAALVCLCHIRPHTLPPTSAAARYHNMRVYLQVQQWLVVCNMKKTDWGG